MLNLLFSGGCRNDGEMMVMMVENAKHPAMRHRTICQHPPPLREATMAAIANIPVTPYPEDGRTGLLTVKKTVDLECHLLR